MTPASLPPQPENNEIASIAAKFLRRPGVYRKIKGIVEPMEFGDQVSEIQKSVDACDLRKALAENHCSILDKAVGALNAEYFFATQPTNFIFF